MSLLWFRIMGWPPFKMKCACGAPWNPDPSYPECFKCGRARPDGTDHRPSWLRWFHELPARNSTRVSSNDQRWLEED